MKKISLALAFLPLMPLLSGCTLSLLRAPVLATPTSTMEPEKTASPSPTHLIATATEIPATSTATPGASDTPTSTILPAAPTPSVTATFSGSPVIMPGLASGPYGVILVAAGDVLNIRSGPGAAFPVTATFSATESSIMRTGPSATVDGALWVEVSRPGGGSGWVNSRFLTEYVPPAAFCANAGVTALITSLDAALTNNDGTLFSSLVSPTHGVSVYLWRYGNPVLFDAADARWVFTSSFEHNWGAAPASGLDTVGSFHNSVLPWLQEVFSAAYTTTCDSLGTAPAYGGEPWPALYSNVNYYTVLKPGTPGIDLDFRFFLVGIEFVQGNPRLFSLIHFAWEP